MTARIAALIADVDGTLVTEDKVLTPRAQEAVHKLHQAGISFAITSGRPPRGMQMFVAPLDLKTPLAGFNGGIFVKPDMSLIEDHLLAPEAAKLAFGLIQDHKMDAWVYTAEDWFVSDVTAPHVAREQWTVKFAPKTTADFSDALTHAVKIVGVSDDADLVERCEKDMQTALGAKASATRSQAYYLDVTNPAANKGAVVAAMAKFLSVPPAEIATIGDGRNDVLMFKQSGFSIAMGNAHADVQKEAKAVTDSYKDEGFAKAVERYVLNQKDAS